MDATARVHRGPGQRGYVAGAGGGAATGDADDLVSRERVGGACCEYVGFAVKR